MRRYKSFFPNPAAMPKSKYDAYDTLLAVVIMKSGFKCIVESGENMVWLTAPNGDEIEIDMLIGLMSMGVNDEGFIQLNGLIKVNDQTVHSYEIQCHKGYQMPVASAFYFANYRTKMDG